MARTKLQHQLVENFQSSVFDQVEGLLKKAEEAKNAVVKLPHKNEQDEAVVHRDNLEMHRLVEVYKSACYPFISQLSKEQEDELNQKYKNWKSW